MTQEHQIIVAAEAGIRLQTVADIPDLIGACFGADGLILAESDVSPAFFDLRTGLLGELFQKCTNYRLHLALVIPDPSVYGERFSELAFEHRTHNLIRFVASTAEARAWLLPAR